MAGDCSSRGSKTAAAAAAQKNVSICTIESRASTLLGAHNRRRAALWLASECQ
jgi:hypothetical protein